MYKLSSVSGQLLVLEYKMKHRKLTFLEFLLCVKTLSFTHMVSLKSHNTYWCCLAPFYRWVVSEAKIVCSGHPATSDRTKSGMQIIQLQGPVLLVPATSCIKFGTCVILGNKADPCVSIVFFVGLVLWLTLCVHTYMCTCTGKAAHQIYSLLELCGMYCGRTQEMTIETQIRTRHCQVYFVFKHSVKLHILLRAIQPSYNKDRLIKSCDL